MEPAGRYRPPEARSWPGAVETAIGRVVATLAALLVAVETGVLFVGVVSRYLLDDPFVWSDELASILFLWLAMLGAVLATRRGEHMRMGALVDRVRPALRPVFAGLALAVELTFLALMLPPSVDYALDEAAILTPALQIPNVWRAAALPVGLALMFGLGLLQLGRRGGLRGFGTALVVVAAAGVGLWLLKPALMAIGNYRLFVFFVGVAGACVLAGVPIGFGFGTATVAFLALTTRGAPAGRDEPHRRGHEPHHPPLGAALRLPRAPHRDHRHGEGDG